MTTTNIKNDDGCRNLIRAILVSGMDISYLTDNKPDTEFLNSEWFNYLLQVYLEGYNYTQNDILVGIQHNYYQWGTPYRNGMRTFFTPYNEQ